MQALLYSIHITSLIYPLKLNVWLNHSISLQCFKIGKMCKFRALLARLFDMPHRFYGQIWVQRGHIGHLDPFLDQNSKILIFLGCFSIHVFKGAMKASLLLFTKLHLGAYKNKFVYTK